MNYNNNKTQFSPTDLVLFMESPFASWMEHLKTVYPAKAPEPDEHDIMTASLQKKGNAHEFSFLKKLQYKGLIIEDITNYENTLEKTIEAMQSGVEVIYQANLKKPPFYGYADFLIKVPGKSLLGDYHYEIWDTKLAKSVKPGFVVQLCCYSEMLAEIQGNIPEYIVLILGDNKEVRLKTNDYFYYYLDLKKNFLHVHNCFDLKNQPDPFESKSWGRWTKYVKSKLIEMDHLSQLANITHGQIKKLNQAGVNTVKKLIKSEATAIQGINASVLEKLKCQAKIQNESIGKPKPLFKILDYQQQKKEGLALLPPDSPLDVFFDIEGFPFEDGGLEYLWGCTFFDANGNRQYKDFWAHDQKEEQEAFKSFINWVYERWQQDPTMHIYHYANYEIAACQRLMSRYGICEDEVDKLLRNEVFVDLYKVFKGGVLLGEPRYSIKNVERLYREDRQTEVATGGDSIIAYESWRNSSDGDSYKTSEILNNIREYNIDDCNSTQELVVWLRERQRENNIEYIDKIEVKEPEVTNEITECTQLRNLLLSLASELLAKDDPDSIIAENLSYWLEFHRRESKSTFWRLFDRMGMSDHELLDDMDCLALCKRTDKTPFKPTLNSQSFAYEYIFDVDQAFKGMGEYYYISGKEDEDGKCYKVKILKEQSKLEEGVVILQAKNEPPSIISLIPDEFVRPDPIPASICAQAKAFYYNQLGSCAILDFLRRSIPRIRGHKQGDPIATTDDSKEKIKQITKAVMNLDNSYLVIQGPPGAGKTYTAQHVIANLLKLGKRIGICSNSHKAINNLLINTVKYCAATKIEAIFICTKYTDPHLAELGVKEVANNKLFLELSGPCVIGTTAWGFSRDDLANSFDYLFIDEAGQVSVANLIAISRSAKNIVLMGDQMQLGQPLQAAHPGKSGLSVLDYLLHDTPTIPETLGVFLGTTYRMHSSINDFISNAIYNGKLYSDASTDKQSIKIPEGYTGVMSKEAGIMFIPVKHVGNTQSSDEEIVEIKKIVNELLGRIYINKNGKQKPIDWEDMLFLSPYNYQVNKLRKVLGESAKVGSVDKFQGQEAPIVFISMCASDPSESPRGASFLLDKHRLNVAVSRAQCLAIIVANPSISQLAANSVDQLAMANIFCHLISVGKHKKLE